MSDPREQSLQYEEATATYPAGEPVPTTPDPTLTPRRSGETERSGDSTTDVAKNEAGAVKDSAVSAGQDVADTAKSEAANVVGETKQQARGLLDSATSEINTQAGAQQRKVATQVHSLAKELGSMASGSSESGPLTDLARQGSVKGGELAHWLEQSEPRDVLRHVQSFARRRPVAFLALCGLAGVVAGRLTRGAVAANTELDSPSKGSTASQSPRRASLEEMAPDAYSGTPTVDYPVGQVPTQPTPGLDYPDADGLGERSGGVR